MYDFIRGTIAELTPTYAVIDAGGVGYFINISLQTFSEIEHESQAKIFVHFIVREDAQALYGFATKQERELFRLLISVSGVGGNTARMILSTYSPGELSNIIASENAALLKNVKGLGLKTAQKIIVELKDKMSGSASQTGMTSSAPLLPNDSYHEAVQALTLLGFTKAASDKVVQNVVREHPSAGVEEIIRLSLKKL